MSLSFEDDASAFGAEGAPGRMGLDRPLSFPSRDGGPGGGGRPGDAASAELGGQGLTGEGGGFAVWGLTAVGGGGGRGGDGGAGTHQQYTDAFPPGGRLTSFLPGGDGGTGGQGGQGGRATAALREVTVTDVGFVGVSALAAGGQGGRGGSGGPGGGAGADLLRVDEFLDPFSGELSRSTWTMQGNAGGDAGAAARGGHGALGVAVIEKLTLRDTGVTLLHALAQGGEGGAGGAGLDGGWGSSAGAAAAGGDGGRGGNAQGVIRGLDLSDQQGLSQALLLHIEAYGGDGGKGGEGGQGGAAVSGSQLVTNAPAGGGSTTRFAFADSAPGGAGGAGGNAAALLQDNRIATGAGNDSVVVFLRAVGGRGGEGGLGGAGVADQSSLIGADATLTFGAAAGGDGARGGDGTAVIRFENNGFILGEGNDSFSLAIQAVGDVARIVFRGNSFDGGAGFDTLDLSGFGSQALGWGAVVDVARGRLSLAGGSLQNSLAGFERFIGSMGDDRFLDGAGDHFYAGGAGQDRFVFTRNHGHDIIEDVEPGDVIEFSRFGARLDSFDDVLARSTDDWNGLVIDTGFGGTLTLLGWQKAALTADMFGFT